MVTYSGYDTMTEKYGRHFCIKCGKLIRIGEKFQWRSIPAPFRRKMEYHYEHHGQCPNNRGLRALQKQEK